MITPEEIREKAQRLYSKVLHAWLDGDDSFFPKTIPSARALAGQDVAAAIDAVQRLRDGSKEKRGFGYTVEWTTRRSRDFGQNEFPARILFENRDDLLRLIGKQAEFERFSSAVSRLRAEFPQLDPWFASHTKLLMESFDDVDGLIDVVRYFLANPRPHKFARELPIAVDTKFIERNQPVLRQ